MRAENLAYKTHKDIVNKRVPSTMIDFAVVLIIFYSFELFLPENITNDFILFWYIISILIYFTFMESLFGYTIGKNILKLRVIDSACNKPKLYQAFFRAVFWIVEVHISFSIIAGIAIYIITRKSRFKQRFGGKVTGTYVVELEELKAFKENPEENSMELDDYIMYLNTPKIINETNALNENVFNPNATFIEIGNEQVSIVGIENMTIDDVNAETKNGAKFFLFYECISVSFITKMYPSNIYLIKAWENKGKYSYIHTLKTLIYGWWGIPGILLMLKTIAINELGGVDMTEIVLRYLNTANIFNKKAEDKKKLLSSVGIKNEKYLILEGDLKMSFTYNGIGAKYFGMKNLEGYQGTCESCGKNTRLRSYDTFKAISVLFIPIIPLGEKKIIDDCSICGRHKVVSVKKWEKIKTESVNLAYDNWIQQPDNIETVNELLNTILYFRDEEKLNSISDQIYSRYSNNAGVMNYLGNIFMSFKQLSKAEEAYRKALQVDDNEEARENLAEVLMKNSKPDDAKQLIWHIVTKKIMEKIYYIFLLIESYQYIGEHMKALRTIEDCENEMPEIKDDNRLSYYRKTSERNYHKNNSIKGNLITYDNVLQRKKKSSFLIPKLIGPSLLLLAFLFYLYTAFNIGASREVYLVNGLDKTYTIVINGEENVLEPLREKLVKLSEGTLDVEFLDLDAPEDSFEIEMNTPFWSRPFNNHIFIINPDKSAAFLWEKTEYTTDAYGNDETEFTIYTGEYFYELRKVDYLFEEFPDTITMEEGTITKTGLIQLDDDFETDIEFLYNFLDEIGEDEAVSYIEKKLYYNPDDYLFLEAYSYYTTYNKLIEYCKSKLSERPVLVNLHRLYQDQIELYEPSYDLEGEYAAYLENDEDNNNLQYLLSRVIKDKKMGNTLLEESIKSDNPCPFGYYGLACNNLYEGNFEEAISYSKKAFEYNPDSLEFSWIYEESLLANKEYDVLLSQNNHEQKLSSQNGVYVEEEIYYRMAKGDIDGANKAIKSYLSRIENLDSKTKLDWERYLNGIIGYCTYDNSTYISGIKGLGSPVLDYETAFLYKDYNKAEKIIFDNYLDISYFLLLYLSEADSEKAKDYLNTAIDIYKEGDKHDILLADYLSESKEWGIEEVKAIQIDPYYKRIIVLALAKTKPKLKEELFDLAGKLNYNLSFPHNTIEEIIESGEI